VPVRSLRGMPYEFQEGMLKRASILRDLHTSQQHIQDLWDPIWVAELNNPHKRVHILITLNANATPKDHPSAEAALEATYQWLVRSCGVERGVTILNGHRGPDPHYQDMAVLADPVKEHFGFTDGSGNPVFEGQYSDPEIMGKEVIGQGKLTADQNWVALATGEFLLGYADEAQETAGGAFPCEFSRNGTYMAYRKLHQNVNAFYQYIDAKAFLYANIHAISPDEASETLRAKMVGRWSDGIPLMQAATFAEWQAERAKIETMAAAKKAAYLDVIQRNSASPLIPMARAALFPPICALATPATCSIQRCCQRPTVSLQPKRQACSTTAAAYCSQPHRPSPDRPGPDRPHLSASSASASRVQSSPKRAVDLPWRQQDAVLVCREVHGYPSDRHQYSQS
jgi:hypothetical protein